MFNNGFFRMLILAIQAAIGHLADMYRPVIEANVGGIGYKIIIAFAIIAVMYTLGIFNIHKENC